MRRALLLADEEEGLLDPYREVGFPLVWVGHRQRYSEALRAHSEFVLQDPGGDLAVLPELRARCAEKGLEPFFVGATDEKNVPYAVRWAEALGARGPCPPGALDFFYDKHEMRRRMAGHSWNVESWLASDLAGLSGGPFVLKHRRGAGSVDVQTCRDRAEVEAAVAGLSDPSAWVVERRIPGREFILDGFSFGGICRLVGMHETYLSGVIEGVRASEARYAHPYIECGHLSGPLFAPEVADALAEELGALLRAQGFVEGPVHAEFRMDGDQPKLVEIHARPGGGTLALTNVLAGNPSLSECYARMLHDRGPPPPRAPSSWVYQRYTKGVALSDAQRASLARDCHGIDIEPLEPLSDAPVMVASCDWDLCIRARAETREEIGRRMNRIEDELADSSGGRMS